MEEKFPGLRGQTHRLAQGRLRTQKAGESHPLPVHLPEQKIHDGLRGFQVFVLLYFVLEIIGLSAILFLLGRRQSALAASFLAEI